MNKFLVGLALVAVAVTGVFFPRPVAEKLAGTVHNVQEIFTNGIKAGTTNQLTVSSTGAVTTTAGMSAATYSTASVGTSSATPAALGSASAGFFTATTTTQLASSTAVTANSQIFLTLMPSSTAFTTLNVACNTAVPTSTPVISKIIAGNGFEVKLLNAPSGSVTPYCFGYRILN